MERNPAEPEFHREVREVLESLVPVVEARPEFITEGIIDCLVDPERIIKFLGFEQISRTASPASPSAAQVQRKRRARPAEEAAEMDLIFSQSYFKMGPIRV